MVFGLNLSPALVSQILATISMSFTDDVVQDD